MIWKLQDLFNHNTKAEINNRWVYARPLNYKHRTLREKIKESYLLFIGKVEAFEWEENQ